MIGAGYHAGRTRLSFYELLLHALENPGSRGVMMCPTKEMREASWDRWKNTEWHVIGFAGFHDISKRTTRFANGSTVAFRTSDRSL